MKKMTIHMRKAFLLLAALLTAVCAAAEDVQILVSALYNPMPPQGMLYIDNPGKYFNITLKNLTDVTQNVYFGIEVKQSFPDNGLSVTTPSAYKPPRGVTIPPNGQVTVTQAQMREMFQYMPLNGVTITGADVLTDYSGGNLGLLPEGTYQARVTVYRLDYEVEYPEVLSNPLQGTCTFDICYNAQAPAFLSPKYMAPFGDAEPETQNDLYTYYGQNDETLEAVALDFDNAVFSWTAPVMSCARTVPVNYTYTLELLRLQPGRNADDAVTDAIKTVSISGINATQYRLNSTVLRQLISMNSYFVARVKAVPVDNDENSDKYTTVMNDGYSPLQVVRFKPQTEQQQPVIIQQEKQQESQEEEEEENAQVEVQEEIKIVNWMCTNPEITKPESSGGITSQMIEADKNIEVEWTKCKAKSMPGDKDTLKYAYDVKLFKMTAGQTVKESLNNSPLYKQTDITGTKATIKWDDIKKQIKINDYLVVAVIPKATNDSSVEFEDNTDNCARLNYVKLVESFYTPCYPDNADTIKDKTLAVFNEKELRDMVVSVCGFPLTIENATLVGKKYYKGKGFITWKPKDFAIKISVEFDSIWINKNKTVYNGVVRSTKDETRDYIPYDLFSGSSSTAVNKIGEGLKEVVNYAQNINDYEFQKYYKLTQQGVMVVDGLFKKDVGPVTFPISLTNGIAPDSDFDVQMLSCEFSPNTAMVNMIGMFTLPESDYTNNRILVFGAPKICIQANSFLPDGAVLSLLTDLSLRDPESGYEWRFTAPTNLDNPEDGCAIVIAEEKLKQVNLEVEMSLNGLLKDNGKGGTVKNTPAQGRFRVEVGGGRWSDWLAEVEIDPFQIEDAPGWTFTTGGIVTYDHSNHSNPKDLKIPADYKTELFKYTATEKGEEIEKTLTGQAGKEMPKEWQGFYMSEVSVKMPKAIEMTEGDDNNIKDTGSEDYKEVDGDNRIGLYLKGVLVDRTGFTGQGGLENMFYGSIGGWKATIDKVYVSIVQNRFGNTGFEGKLGVPILEGDVGYECKLSYYDRTKLYQKPKEQPDGAQEPESDDHLKMEMKLKQVKDLKMPCFLGDVDFDSKSHFSLEYYSEGAADGKDSTAVELTLTGQYTIRTEGESEAKKTENPTTDKKTPLALDLPSMRFYGMRIANFSYVEKELKDPKTQPGWDKLTKDEQKKKTEEYETEKKDREGTSLYTYENKEKHVYFDLGRWRTASPQKKLGGFSFSLDKFEFKEDKKNGTSRLGLKLEGTIGIMDDKLSATAGFTIWTKGLSLSFESLQNMDQLEYDTIEFNKAALKGDLGGIKLEGSLEVESSKEKSGFAASLKVDLPGDLLSDGKQGSGKGIDVKGHFFEILKTEEELKEDLDHIQYKAQMGRFDLRGKPASYWVDSTYHSVSLEVVASMTINCGPVTITKVGGGFFIHSNRKGEPVYGLHGGMLEVGLASPDGKMLKADPVELTCFYDARNEKLSTIRLIGKITGAGGLVDADACIVYSNETPDDHYFMIDITADAKVDGQEAYEKLTGTKLEIPECMAGLESLDAKNDDTQKGKESDSETQEKAAKQAKVSASAHASLNLKITLEPDNWSKTHPKENFPEKWHLWLGQPTDENGKYDESKRCNITLIDYQLGEKTDAVAMWGKLYANAYLCIGNELPNDGKLPPIPDNVQKFLDGTNEATGEQQNLTSQLKRPDPTTFDGKGKGGMMLGATIGGSFGLNAAVCYADVEAVAGFDFILKELDNGCGCGDNTHPGKNGMYATGQVYAMLQGEMGLMIDVFFFQGRYPLVSVGLGALLKGGMPNPTWVYGKVRAKASLLNGLIEYNATAELKAGDVCVPTVEDPLHDVEIFGSVSPGYETSAEGWTKDDNRVSQYTPIQFNTNMPMGQYLDLIDEDRMNRAEANATEKDLEDSDIYNRWLQEATRTFVFHLDPTMTLELSGSRRATEHPTWSPNPEKGKVFNLKVGTLDPDTHYKLILSGYAKEVVGGKEVDPWCRDAASGYKEVQRKWTDKKEVYFCTEKLPDDIDNDIVFGLPSGKGQTKAFADEAKRPELHLRQSRTDMFSQDPGVRLIGRLEEKHSRLGWIPANSNFNTMYVYDPKNDLTFTYQNNKLIRESVGFDRYYNLGDEQEAMASALKDDKSGTVLSTVHKDYMAVNYGGKIYIYNTDNESVFDSYDSFGIEEKNEEDCYWWQPSADLPVEKGKQYRYTILVQKQSDMLVAYDRMLDDLEKSLDETKNTKKAVVTGTVDAFRNAGGDGNGVVETDDSYNYANMMQQLNDEIEAAYGEDNTVVSTYKFHNVVAESGFEKVLYQIEFEVGEYDNFYQMCLTEGLKDNIGQENDFFKYCDSYGVGIIQDYSYSGAMEFLSDQDFIIQKADQTISEKWKKTLSYDPYGALIYLTDWALPGGLTSTEESQIDTWSKLGSAKVTYPTGSLLSPFREKDEYTGGLVPNNVSPYQVTNWFHQDPYNNVMSKHVGLIKPVMTYTDGYFFENGYDSDPNQILGTRGVPFKTADDRDGKSLKGVVDSYKSEFEKDAEFTAAVWQSLNTMFANMSTFYVDVYNNDGSLLDITRRNNALKVFKSYYESLKNVNLTVTKNSRQFTVPYKTVFAAYAMGRTVMCKDYALWDEFEPEAQKSYEDYSSLYYSSGGRSKMEKNDYDDYMGGTSPRRAYKYALACNSLMANWKFDVDEFKKNVGKITIGFYRFDGYRSKHTGNNGGYDGFCIRGSAADSDNYYIITIKNPYK